jgi:hypothetical protein
LPNGIPSHDTFNRFFQLLDPSDFEECFIRWTQSIVGELKRENISIDDKSMRGRKQDNSGIIRSFVSNLSNYEYNLF